MACTIQELQDVQYEMLCKFADYCDRYSIKYSLAYGTLIGAVRHQGFIPWDDDVDVIMDASDFKKFVRKYKKDPIEGITLCWPGNEKTYPLWFGKIRKDGTSMPEENYNNLDIHHGAWIDLFTYSAYPENKFIAKIRDKMYDLFLIMSKIYKYKDNGTLEKEIAPSKKLKLIAKIPDGLNCKIRSMLYNVLTSLGKKNSKYIAYNDWGYTRKPLDLRENFEPQTKLKFNDREFSVPAKYDTVLSMKYGDYMTPIEYPTHTDFSKVDL